MKHEISNDLHFITIDDDFLFHRQLHFCNWRCIRKFMEQHNFAVKKEQLFSVIGV